MQIRTPHRVLLVLSGLVAGVIGASLLLVPAAFHATSGIELGADASLLSEVRAPGGALLALGALILTGAFARSLAFASTGLAAVVYLAYGLSRLVGVALDGVPAPGVVAATAIELALGVACLVALLRSRVRHEAPASTVTGLAEEA